MEWRLTLESCASLSQLGRWDDALARIGELEDTNPMWSLYWATEADLLARRGEVAEARRLADDHVKSKDTQDVQERTWFAAGNAAILAAEGKFAESLESAEAGIDNIATLSSRHEAVRRAFVSGIEAALALGRLDKVEELLARIDAFRPGELPAFLEGQRSRFRARLAAAQGRDREVESGFKAASRLFLEYGLVFWRALVQLEHGEWLAAHGRAGDAELFLAEARETFERLSAQPYLERVAAVQTERAAEPAVASS